MPDMLIVFTIYGISLYIRPDFLSVDYCNYSEKKINFYFFFIRRLKIIFVLLKKNILRLCLFILRVTLLKVIVLCRIQRFNTDCWFTLLV